MRKIFTTNEEAIKHIENLYTGIYKNIAICQFKLSRQTKNIEDSLKDVGNKIIEVTTRIIERQGLDD